MEYVCLTCGATADARVFGGSCGCGATAWVEKGTEMSLLGVASPDQRTISTHAPQAGNDSPEGNTNR